jgi:hypothetical protein
MGSPERLYSPKDLKSLSKSQIAQLGKELKRLLRVSPAARKIIKAHEAENKKLRKKLAPTLKALRAAKP